ncbi:MULTISPECIES: glycoside hydrolase family 26 protein [unclassified Streptomyces]|uniref:glycoside hydrolase family 26 protein n=1 Tax=unclassified Streptomyces TaxID=2593676 RepID=UPI002E104D29|nr:glycosyl hydrolase [Streptomyces sp. NBC_01213]WSR04613.1 glycosyl hydrolase [Streptomyces sp. NBC_01208]
MTGRGIPFDGPQRRRHGQGTDRRTAGESAAAPKPAVRRFGAGLASAALVTATVLIATSCSTAGEEPATSSSATAPLEPSEGALLGHYYGDGTVEETDARIGTTPGIHLTYYGWEDDWSASEATRDDLSGNRIPLVNWEPFDVDFDDIIDGSLDATIEKRADGAKELGEPFFLDFAAEMNEEEGWGGHDPERYIAAYRHIHDIFEDRGASNVVWVWAPNVTDSPDAPAAMSYYPGDRYVDWTGIDGYNWGTSDPDFEWQGFTDLFRDIYGKLAAKGKPIIIGETGSDETGGSKAEWIQGIVPGLKDEFPLIKALVWFDVDKERHWQIASSPAALAAYRRMAADPYLTP